MDLSELEFTVKISVRRCDPNAAKLKPPTTFTESKTVLVIVIAIVIGSAKNSILHSRTSYEFTMPCMVRLREPD